MIFEEAFGMKIEADCWSFLTTTGPYHVVCTMLYCEWFSRHRFRGGHTTIWTRAHFPRKKIVGDFLTGVNDTSSTGRLDLDQGCLINSSHLV
jgi:hypothetical protein